MRIAGRPCQTVVPHQQVPSAWIASITRRLRAASPTLTITWFSTTSVQHVMSRCTQPRRKPLRVPHAAADRPGHAGPAQGPERRLHLHAPGAAGGVFEQVAHGSMRRA